MTRDEFNAADREAAIAWLRPCLDIERWCVELVDGRPYESADALLAAAGVDPEVRPETLAPEAFAKLVRAMRGTGS